MPRAILYLTLFLVFYSEAGKILVYSPSISPSHILSNGRIAETLAEAGHEVVVLIPELLKSLANYTAGIKNAKIIRIPGIGEPYESLGFEGDLMESEFVPLKMRTDWEVAVTDSCANILDHKDVLDSLRAMHFDAAFTEQIEFCGIGLIHHLGIKNLLWLSTTPLMDANSYNLGIPQPTSYVPVIEETAQGDRMTFWGRLDNQINYFKSMYVHHYGTDLMTEKLAKTMEKGRLGVVFFSLGSVALFDTIPLPVRQQIIRDFAAMKDYHFVIKISNEDDTTDKLLAGIPNIETVHWIPQSDLLGHPRLKLFVTHGGINGMIEAVHRAVPLVVVPMFADQFRNGRNAERRGIGKMISKLQLDQVGKEVKKILSDESYANAAKALAKKVKAHPYQAKEVLLRWTEYVLAYGPLDDLTLEGSKMGPITYFNLDVLALLMVPPLLFVLAIFFAIRATYRLCCSGGKQKKE
ncbi:unnamed protein product, partial [Mesorhabditis spiculigera]